MNSVITALHRSQESSSDRREHPSRHLDGLRGKTPLARRLLVAAALMMSDVVAFFVAIQIYPICLQIMGTATTGLTHSLLACAYLFVNLTLGMYFGFGTTPYERFRLRGMGILLLATLNILISWRDVGLAPLLIANGAFAFALLTFSFYADWFVRTLLVRQGLWGATTALVGCSPLSRQLANTLIRLPELGLRPVGFICSNVKDIVPSEDLPLPILGTIEDFPEIEQSIEVAVLTNQDQLGRFKTRPGARSAPTQFIAVNDTFDIQTLWVRTRVLGNLVGLQLKHTPYLSQNPRVKRVIDLCIAVPAGLILAPLIGALALLVKLVDPGPAFYVQKRIGKDGQLFGVPKLRTMYRDSQERLQRHLDENPDAEREWKAYFKLANDPRILPRIGQFLRKTSLDELPQLWTIIRGDMSLVGPRPFPDYHMESFDPDFRSLRTAVPPGLTGLWQVSSRSNGDLTVQRDQDMYYIRNWSIWLDLYILFETIPAVLAAHGAK